MSLCKHDGNDCGTFSGFPEVERGVVVLANISVTSVTVTSPRVLFISNESFVLSPKKERIEVSHKHLISCRKKLTSCTLYGVANWMPPSLGKGKRLNVNGPCTVKSGYNESFGSSRAVPCCNGSLSSRLTQLHPTNASVSFLHFFGILWSRVFFV